MTNFENPQLDDRVHKKVADQRDEWLREPHRLHPGSAAAFAIEIASDALNANGEDERMNRSPQEGEE